jgi:hypothetical protein
MDWSGGSFDQFGENWIRLKCAYYGVIGLLVGLIFMLVLTRSARNSLLFCIPIAMIVVDFLPPDELWSCSFVDKTIDFVGYSISRIFRYTPQDSPVPSGTSAVLSPMTCLEVETPKGRLSITTGHGLLRRYTWDGVSRSLELIPPNKQDNSFHTRHYSANRERVASYDWQIHNGITRGEAWETRINFKSVRDADVWLEGQQDEALPCVWTHDGLVVGWSTEVDSQALTIMVYQVLVNGQKPSSLHNSNDSKFILRSVLD